MMGSAQAQARAQDHAQAEDAIAAHFAGRRRPRAERRMRAHLAACTACRACYDRYLLLARIDPAAPPAQDRLARTLGFAAPSARGSAGWRMGLALAASAAVAAGVALAPRAVRPVAGGADSGGSGSGSGSQFAARGAGAAPGPEVLIYRLTRGGGAARPVAGAVSARDELAFAYRNPSGKRHVMVFAVDEHRHVYWYHPAWMRAEENPSAVPVSTAPGLHELPAAVVQDLDGEKLAMHALFSDRELTVREVERAVARAAGSGAAWGRSLAIPETIDVVRSLLVAR